MRDSNTKKRVGEISGSETLDHGEKTMGNKGRDSWRSESVRYKMKKRQSLY